MARSLRVSPTALLVLVLVMVATLPSASRAYQARARASNCSICRYAIIRGMFDACFFHFCYTNAVARKHRHALMKRALPSDWLTVGETLGQKRSVPTDWWGPPGLLFWANPSEKSPSRHN
ncbi:hypothetical protein V1264_009260 [Littorina saxatilis]|uniref:Secreted protein n=1 Tax=Littorina saxatilis TaxID=31220 RepID=A0AAN9ARY1_9CAEN